MFIDHWDDAQELLVNFKRWYLKKQIIGKTEKPSTSSASVEEAQKDFDPHLFSSWVNLYLTPREAKTNMTNLDAESVCAITFPSNFLGSFLLSVKAMHLKIYIMSIPVSLDCTYICSRVQAFECT